MILRQGLLIFLILALKPLLIAQELPLGIYEPIYADPFFTFEILEGNRFQYIHYGHLNQITRGHGKIAIEGDSIHFHFEPLKLEEKYLSKFELKSVPESYDGSLTIKLSTYDITDSIPMEAVWVGWSDEKSIPNEYFFTDEKGQLTMYVRKPMDKGFIRIRQMFYQGLKIRLDTIKSVSSEIKAYMNPSGQFVIENVK